MRDKSVLLAILPLANALSLANFQQITSTSIPLSCQLQYDSQIPTCTVSDFDVQCSTGCESALKSVAQSVNNACSGVSVSSNTLLGIVKSGGIIAALCPSVAQATTSSPPDSVTIPTTSPGVVLTTPKSSKTTTTPLTFTPTTEITQSTTDASTKSSSTTKGPGTTSSTSTKKDSTTTTSKKTSATTTTATKKTNQQSDSGGGSPFDISSSGSAIGGASVFALLIAVCAGLMLGL